MAAHGYEDERFESPVSGRFHCSICLNVFNDPVMCRQNQHIFCRGCISKHLENYRTCPQCKDQLNLDQLSVVPRILTDYLDELRIRCEFVQRGCEEFVQLQYLKKHVEECGYAPVSCSNEGCQREVNRRDLTHHEFVECEERQLKCHHCERLSKDVDILKEKVTGMEEKFDTACANVYAAVEVKLDSFQNNFKEQQKNIDDSLTSLKRSNSSIKGNLKKLIKVMGVASKKIEGRN